MIQTSQVDLVGVGLNATDTVIPISEVPVRGNKVEYTSETILLGGQTASTVWACQKWGLKTRYVGKLGDDDAGRMHAEEFARTGVDAKLIYAKDVPSPKSLIFVDHEGERTVFCRRDERVSLQPEELEREWIVNARALHVDGFDTDAAVQAVTWAREAGVPVIADLDETYEGIDKLLDKIDYMIVSKYFPQRLTGDKNLPRALKQMKERYGAALTASTLGPDGVLAWDGERYVYRPAYRVPVADSTGAGDTFHAAFIYGLMQGWPLERKLEFASAAAACNCMAIGARGGTRSVEEIEQMMKTTPRYECPKELRSVAG